MYLQICSYTIPNEFLFVYALYDIWMLILSLISIQFDYLNFSISRNSWWYLCLLFSKRDQVKCSSRLYVQCSLHMESVFSHYERAPIDCKVLTLKRQNTYIYVYCVIKKWSYLYTCFRKGTFIQYCLVILKRTL